MPSEDRGSTSNGGNLLDANSTKVGGREEPYDGRLSRTTL